MQIDTITYILSLAGAASGGFGIGYKFCPKSKPQATITTIKRDCDIYKRHFNSRFDRRRFEVVLKDGIAYSCNCPKLNGKICTLEDTNCYLLS